jgi:hypothetical protein
MVKPVGVIDINGGLHRFAKLIRWKERTTAVVFSLVTPKSDEVLELYQP